MGGYLLRDREFSYLTENLEDVFMNLLLGMFIPILLQHAHHDQWACCQGIMPACLEMGPSHLVWGWNRAPTTPV